MSSNTLLITDLDGTVLDQGKITQENSEVINKLKGDGANIVVSTGKGKKRIHNDFVSCPFQILENGAKVVLNGKTIEYNIEGENLEKLISLLKTIEEQIEFLFLYDSKDGNNAHFYINERNGINTDWREKFDNIWSGERVHDIKELENSLKQGRHSLGLLNIKLKTNSFQKLGIQKDDYKGLNIVFNEGMLNISITDKGEATKLIIDEIGDKVNKIIIAGNDENDLPMMKTIIDVVDGTKKEIGIIVVGEKIDIDDEIKDIPNDINVIWIEEPKYWHLAILNYLTK